MSRKKDRKAEVKQLREEGITAFVHGRHRISCPYHRTSKEHQHWLQGFDFAKQTADDAALR